MLPGKPTQLFLNKLVWPTTTCTKQNRSLFCYSSLCDRGFTGIYEPSVEPAHCGKPHFPLEHWRTSFSCSPVGNEMCKAVKFMTIVLHISWTTTYIMHLGTPKRWVAVRCSNPADNVMATCCSTDSVFLSLAISFSSKSLSWSHK